MATTIGTQNPLEHADLAIPPLHIPDGGGGSYKTELVVSRTTERVVKIHWWHAPDPRRDPHNHPWPFKSTILAGGYTETRWTYRDGLWESTQHSYRVGDVNDMPHGVFHTVDSVLPGTTTRMETGALASIRVGPWSLKAGEWGYLVNSEFVPQGPSPGFLEDLRAINPHKRPATVVSA